MTRLCVAKQCCGWIIMMNPLFIEANAYMMMINRKVQRQNSNANSNASLVAKFNATLLKFVTSSCFEVAENIIVYQSGVNITLKCTI